MDDRARRRQPNGFLPGDQPRMSATVLDELGASMSLCTQRDVSIARDRTPSTKHKTNLVNHTRRSIKAPPLHQEGNPQLRLSRPRSISIHHTINTVYRERWKDMQTIRQSGSRPPRRDRPSLLPYPVQPSLTPIVTFPVLSMVTTNPQISSRLSASMPRRSETCSFPSKRYRVPHLATQLCRSSEHSRS